MHARKNMYTHEKICTHAKICTYAKICTRTQKYARTQKYVHARKNMYAHENMCSLKICTNTIICTFSDLFTCFIYISYDLFAYPDIGAHKFIWPISAFFEGTIFLCFEEFLKEVVFVFILEAICEF